VILPSCNETKAVSLEVEVSRLFADAVTESVQKQRLAFNVIELVDPNGITTWVEDGVDMHASEC
jgi:hypothetical protein